MNFSSNMQVQKVLCNSIVRFSPKFTSTSDSSAVEQSRPDFDIPKSYETYSVETYKPSKIFEGMTKKEVDFLLSGKVNILSVYRGCSNGCKHCCVSASPHVHDNNTVSRLPYEDFDDIMKGFAQLRNLDAPALSNSRYTLLYFDSDCMEMALKDKLGNEYDYTDLHKLFYKSTGAKTIFDTAGWNPKSTRMQDRAEKYVKYLSDNMDKFYQVNLSFSPFHSIYAKSIELGLYDNIVGEKKNKADKLYNLYTDRIANMLFTFSPLLKFDNFSVITRFADDKDLKMKEYSIHSYKKIMSDVLSKLYKMYLQDLSGEQKYVHNIDEVAESTKKYITLLSRTDREVLMAGRYKELYMSLHPELNENEIDNDTKDVVISNIKLNLLKSNLYKAELINNNYSRLIDTNGKVYLYDNYHLIPTELQLNTSTKGKVAPDLLPQPCEDFVITREMINSL